MKRHHNVTLRDIQSQTTAKKSKLDALKVIKEESKVAGCDFQQRESADVAEYTTGETLGDDKEPASGIYHAHEAPTAIPGSLQINVTGSSGYPSPDAGVLFQRMHLSKVLVKSNRPVPQRM